MVHSRRQLMLTTVIDAEHCAVLRVAGELDVHTEQRFLHRCGTRRPVHPTSAAPRPGPSLQAA
ncbi:hypothetical protein ACH4FX_42020 [Streptomyces sp. NPDC018019]|uniref:hypothetical protein n=1 Tax=Streptomyces sp. NPDC018019 TaxID=3365030 RepID=UPI00378BAE8A